MPVFFQKPKTPEHKYVIYRNTDQGTIADKDEDGDIILYTDIDAKIEIDEDRQFGEGTLKVEIKHNYTERFQAIHSVVDGTTRTFGMTPKQRE